jgi:hypothetical protein
LDRIIGLYFLWWFGSAIDKQIKIS